MALTTAFELAQKTLCPLALGLLALFPPPQAQTAPDPSLAGAAPNFSGRFRLNAAQSEDPREKMREAMKNRRPEGGGGGMPRGSGGGPRGGPGGPRPDGEGGQWSSLEAAKAMTVTHTAFEIAVVEDDGRLRTLHPDGRAYKAENGALDVKTRWDAGRLVVETKSERGPKAIETWSLDAQGRLVIQTNLEGPHGSVQWKRVYDRDASES
jgi:hypothetical protein